MYVPNNCGVMSVDCRLAANARCTLALSARYTVDVQVFQGHFSKGLVKMSIKEKERKQ